MHPTLLALILCIDTAKLVGRDSTLPRHGSPDPVNWYRVDRLYDVADTLYYKIPAREREAFAALCLPYDPPFGQDYYLLPDDPMLIADQIAAVP